MFNILMTYQSARMNRQLTNNIHILLYFDIYYDIVKQSNDAVVLQPNCFEIISSVYDEKYFNINKSLKIVHTA